MMVLVVNGKLFPFARYLSLRGSGPIELMPMRLPKLQH